VYLITRTPHEKRYVKNIILPIWKCRSDGSCKTGRFLSRFSEK